PAQEEALAAEPVEHREKGLEARRLVDDHDDDGHGLLEVKGVQLVDAARRPESLQAPEGAGARQARLARPVHDLGVDGLVAMLVGLLDEDRDSLTGSLQLHRRLPSRRGRIRPATTPAQTAPSPTTRLATT